MNFELMFETLQNEINLYQLIFNFLVIVCFMFVFVKGKNE